MDEWIIPIDCLDKILQPSYVKAMTRVIQINEYLRVPCWSIIRAMNKVIQIKSIKKTCGQSKFL